MGLMLMLLAVGLLVAPGAFHQIVEPGNDSPRVTEFTGQIAFLALFPFALALGIDVYVAAQLVLNRSLRCPPESERRHSHWSSGTGWPGAQALLGFQLAAMLIPLALGIAGDFYVVLVKVLDSTSLAVAFAAASLVFFFGLWFGVTFAVRWRISSRAVR